MTRPAAAAAAAAAAKNGAWWRVRPESSTSKAWRDHEASQLYLATGYVVLMLEIRMDGEKMRLAGKAKS